MSSLYIPRPCGGESLTCGRVAMVSFHPPLSPWTGAHQEEEEEEMKEDIPVVSRQVVMVVVGQWVGGEAEGDRGREGYDTVTW